MWCVSYGPDAESHVDRKTYSFGFLGGRSLHAKLAKLKPYLKKKT